jgi:cystathionine beta-synthase
MFNDNWMADQGFTHRKGTDDAFSLVSRKIEEGEVVYARSGDTILSAYNKMKLYDISQLPVLDGTKIIGILDESDILIALTEGGDEAFWKKVSDFMSKDLVTVLPSASIDDVLSVLKKGFVAVVKEEERFYGLITRIDFLSYLRDKIRK